MKRRRHAALSVFAASWIVGCGANPGPRDASADTGAESPDAGSDASAPQPDAGARDPYADVVAVSTSGADGAFSFSVSIESSDTGCDRYADWWEVVGEDGGLLYRRTLAHSHTDDNGTTDPGAPGNTFTRSGGPVGVSAAQTVIVRAHLHPEGYVGRSMRGSIEAGFDAFTPPAGFANALAAAAPQPPACAF